MNEIFIDTCVPSNEQTFNGRNGRRRETARGMSRSPQVSQQFLQHYQIELNQYGIFLFSFFNFLLPVEFFFILTDFQKLFLKIK